MRVVFISLLFFAAYPLYAAIDEYDYGAYRVGGPPDYRNYDRVSSYEKKTYTNSSYRPEDANSYWGNQYYHNENPNPGESSKMDLRIWELEQGVHAD